MKFFGVFAFCLLFAANASAQTAAPKITSTYTNLSSNCKSIEGDEGTDTVFDCWGIGGYRIYVWYSATTQEFSAQVPKTKEMIPLATQSVGFDPRNIKVEWRMADGKPFAVIMRVAKYVKTNYDRDPVGRKVGEELIIRGLKGFEKIEGSVDARTPNANESARKLADTEYLKILLGQK